MHQYFTGRYSFSKRRGKGIALRNRSKKAPKAEKPAGTKRSGGSLFHCTASAAGAARKSCCEAGY